MAFDLDLPDHPEIRWIENTGYPSFAQPEIIRCEYCERELDDSDEVYEDSNHEVLCKSCLLNLHEKWW